MFCVLLFPRGCGNYCIHHLITSALKIKQSFQQHPLWSQGRTPIRTTKPVHTGVSLIGSIQKLLPLWERREMKHVNFTACGFQALEVPGT